MTHLPKKKLLMVIPELGYGGAARSFSNLSVELAKHYDVKIVVFNMNCGFPSMYQLRGGVINLNIASGKTLLKKLTAFMARIRALKKIKFLNNIDVSISFLEGADYINILSRDKDKVIISIRGSKKHDGNICGAVGMFRKTILIPLLYARSNCIVSVCNGLVGELKNDFNLRAVNHHVINNFYDFELISRLGDEPICGVFAQLTGHSYLVICSRLAREKNIIPLVLVYSRMRRQGLEEKLVIVGDGPDFDKIKKCCSEQELSYLDRQGGNKLSDSDVICVGAQNNPYPFVKNSKAYLMASESEGFPNSLVEALILSVPVVSSDCPWGPREILDDSLGEKNLTLEQYPVVGKYGVLMPMLNDTKFSISNWSDNLLPILKDERALDRCKRASVDIHLQYVRSDIMKKWVSVIESV